MSKDASKLSDQLLDRIQSILEDARSKVYRTANTEMLRAYWNIGREIVVEEQKGEKRASYGATLLNDLAKRLTEIYGKSFSSRHLRYMRQFYRGYPKWNAVRSTLSWTHYRILLKVENERARTFYENEAVAGNWSTRQLERQINSLYFDRLILSKDRAGLKHDVFQQGEHMQAGDFIKDPFVLEFLDVQESEKLTEALLESVLIEKLQQFILELGNGFSFVGRQYRITVDNDHYYIDLVLYNYLLKCFMLIDLKTEKLRHQDIGQMDFYVRFFEDQIKQKNDNSTIGLILCIEKNNTIVKYSLLNESKQIFASKYQLYLPTEEQLMDEMQRNRNEIEQEENLR